MFTKAGVGRVMVAKRAGDLPPGMFRSICRGAGLPAARGREDRYEELRRDGRAIGRRAYVWPPSNRFTLLHPACRRAGSAGTPPSHEPVLSLTWRRRESSTADRKRLCRGLICRGADDPVKHSVQTEACETRDPNRYQGISRRRQDAGRIAGGRCAEIGLAHGITPGSENYEGMNLATRRAPNG